MKTWFGEGLGLLEICSERTDRLKRGLRLQEMYSERMDGQTKEGVALKRNLFRTNGRTD